MDLDKIENAIEEMAEDVDVSVDEIRALICGAVPKLLGLTKIKATEAFHIKRLLMKAALRQWEEQQRELKKKVREAGDWRSKYQSKAAYKAWDITTLLRQYAELRGKDPSTHSLDKWAGQEGY